MKTLVDVDDEVLERARLELGTTTKKDTVNAALRFVVERRQRIQDLFDESRDVGGDIHNAEIMQQARR